MPWSFKCITDIVRNLELSSSSLLIFPRLYGSWAHETTIYGHRVYYWVSIRISAKLIVSIISKCYIDVIRPLEISSTIFSIGDANLHTSSKVATFLSPYMVILQTVNVMVTKCIMDV